MGFEEIKESKRSSSGGKVVLSESARPEGKAQRERVTSRTITDSDCASSLRENGGLSGEQTAERQLIAPQWSDKFVLQEPR